MTLEAMLIAGLGFIVIAGLGFALTSGSKGADSALKRVNTFTASGRTAKAKTQREKSRQPDERRKQILTHLKETERRERKARLSLNARMLQAGLEPDLKKYWIICAVLGVVAFGLLFVTGINPLIALVGSGVAGLGLPVWVLNIMAGMRLKKFTLLFPDAIDILVRGIKTGLPVNDCIRIIAKESPAPLGPAFQRLVDNVGVGMALDQALEKIYESLPSAELRFFAIVLAIQQKTGGNLAEALSNLSTVLRSRKMLGEKIKALSSEAVSSAFIIGMMPPGVAALIASTNYEFIRVLFEDPRGHMLLLGGACWMGIGIFIMHRMISFKF